MSSAADLVLDNFTHRIAAIAPDTAIIRDRFRCVDPRDIDDGSAHPARTFSVTWTSSGPPIGVEDDTERHGLHEFAVDVRYRAGQTGMGHHRLQRVMLRDLHELKKTLRDPDNYNGTNVDSAKDTNLHARWCTGAERIDQSESITILRTTWACEIMELE